MERRAHYPPAMPSFQTPPRGARGIVKHLGPGLIISANIVGSGELIVTTKLGADVGFMLLWFIILGCVVKVFLQVELGRYAVSKGMTTLEALNSIPGPRFRVSWLVWCWFIMFVATFFQLAGMVGALAGVFRLGGSGLHEGLLALFITASCAGLLLVGRYRFIERFSTIMVASFTIFTIFAVFSLYWTDFGIKASHLAKGFQMQIPEDSTAALAAFGVIGVGASELIFYPYWCLEKGYARYVGPDDGTEARADRARGWIRVLRWDAWASMVIYTGATVAFYLLGAAVLHGQNIEVTPDNLMSKLSNLYTTSFGTAGLWVFLVGSVLVLYSTVFISTASNGRLSVDLLHMLGLVKSRDAEIRARHVALACVALSALYLIFYLGVKDVLALVFAGAIAQALMLPFLCGAALYFLYTQTAPGLRPGKVWVLFVWLSALMMTMVGVYKLIDEIKGRLRRESASLEMVPGQAGPGLPAASFDRIGHEHGDGHGAHAARDRCDRLTLWRDGLEIDVPQQPVALAGRWVLHAVDADIDDDRPRAHVIRGDEVGSPDGSHEDVCGSGDLGEMPRSRMGDGHSGVGPWRFSHEEQA